MSHPRWLRRTWIAFRGWVIPWRFIERLFRRSDGERYCWATLVAWKMGAVPWSHVHGPAKCRKVTRSGEPTCYCGHWDHNDGCPRRRGDREASCPCFEPSSNEHPYAAPRKVGVGDSVQGEGDLT